MIQPLSFNDYGTLSPWLILLAGSLLILLKESFNDGKRCHAAVGWGALATIGLAAAALFAAPASNHPLIASWLYLDHAARTFGLLLLFIGFACALLAMAFFARQAKSSASGEYYFLLLSCLFGLLLIGAAADLLMVFIGLETLSIALYVLCSYMKRWQLSSEGAIKYFLMGALATSLWLYGAALLYGATGTTQLRGLLDAYHRLPAADEQWLFLAGIALITLGLGFKAAIVPFHMWAPDVYASAPTPVTAFMAVGTKVGAFAALSRIFLQALPSFYLPWSAGIAYLAIPTLVYANFVALRQGQLRRFFAYSGISHAGFLLLPLAASVEMSMSALLFYLAVYAIATLGAFSVLTALDHGEEGPRAIDIKGLFYRAPFLGSVLATSLLTLAGMPPTVGFLAKFYLFKVAFEAGHILVVLIALATTVIAAIYYLRFVALIFADNPHGSEDKIRILWPAMIVAIFSLFAMIVYSCFPSCLLQAIGS